MIIFDLDGTLADCEHRRHFVQKNHPHNMKGLVFDDKDEIFIRENHTWGLLNRDPLPNWKPDWKSFYEACDQDKLIQPTWRVFISILDTNSLSNIQIWSGRCESVRKKTEAWLGYYLSPSGKYPDKLILKMRPIGDNTPDDELKMKWLDEAIAEGKTIDFVFDDRPKVVRAWRKRGIFVFNTYQHDEEF